MGESADVLVLGAGPAGLMAALRASARGLRCTVLEAAPTVGGMAGSFEVSGQRVDYGSHRLHPAASPALLGRLQDLLGDDLQVRPRSGRLRLDERWVGFPLRAGDLVRRLPPQLTIRLLTDAAVTTSAIRVGRRLRPPPSPTTFHDEVVARLGPTVADRFYDPYAHKLYGLDATELDGELARRRISASSPLDIARRIARATRPSGRTFLYPKRGYGQLAEAIADAAVTAGASIHLSTPVTGIEAGDDRTRVTAGGRRFEAGVALSTIPTTTLARLVDPAPPPAVATAIEQLSTRAMVLVYLVLDRPQYTRFDAHYLPGPETVVARLSEPKNYRDGDDPADRTVLCAEIPCWRTDDLWEWCDDELGAVVVDGLGRAGLPDATPVAVETRRLPSVYPVYDIAGIAARSVVDDWNRSIGRVVPLGRQGLRVVDNLHHVIEMGAAAAESIGADLAIDERRWLAHLDRFGSHVVED